MSASSFLNHCKSSHTWISDRVYVPALDSEFTFLNKCKSLSLRDYVPESMSHCLHPSVYAWVFVPEPVLESTSLHQNGGLHSWTSQSLCPSVYVVESKSWSLCPGGTFQSLCPVSTSKSLFLNQCKTLRTWIRVSVYVPESMPHVLSLDLSLFSCSLQIIWNPIYTTVFVVFGLPITSTDDITLKLVD